LACFPARFIGDHIFSYSRRCRGYGLQNPHGNRLCPHPCHARSIWGKIYIWLSIVLLLFVVVWMGLVNEKQIKQLRRLVGLPYMQGNKEFPAEAPASPEEVVALLKRINPIQWAIVGYGIPAFILWLMIFKPF
jgi:hypothetical protein